MHEKDDRKPVRFLGMINNPIPLYRCPGGRSKRRLNTKRHFYCIIVTYNVALIAHMGREKLSDVSILYEVDRIIVEEGAEETV